VDTNSSVSVASVVSRVVVPLAVVLLVMVAAIGSVNTLFDAGGPVEFGLVVVFSGVYYAVAVLLYAWFEHLYGLRT